MRHFNRRSFLLASTAAVAASSWGKLAAAQVATPDPALLRSTLTPMGAERAGNADGSIPAWTGGYTTAPPGYVSGQPRPDPFAAESPILVINAANVDAYSGKLAQGVIELIKRNPDTFHLNVYPTHRTAAAPQYVYDNAYLNVTRSVISADGTNVTGAYGGPPFPIPSNGFEVMWNHLTVYQGEALQSYNGNFIVTSHGEAILATETHVVYQFPYYFTDGSPETFGGIFREFCAFSIAPATQEGNAFMGIQTLNQKANPPKTLQYLPGQRRIREAPDLGYDTPNVIDSGVSNDDEVAVYFGRMDQYDFKLLGKRDVYLPYNENRVWLTPFSQQLGPKHFNPDIMRWELHRVWVVEATLLPGARNVDARRVFYVDEDSWNAIMADVYDAGNTYWKFIHATPIICYDLPALLGNVGVLTYDFHAGDYALSGGCDPKSVVQYEFTPRRPQSYFSGFTLESQAGGQ